MKFIDPGNFNILQQLGTCLFSGYNPKYKLIITAYIRIYWYQEPLSGALGAIMLFCFLSVRSATKHEHTT